MMINSARPRRPRRAAASTAPVQVPLTVSRVPAAVMPKRIESLRQQEEQQQQGRAVDDHRRGASC